jgi:hypothetical protein
MAQKVQCLIALGFDSLPTDSEFVGMTDYISESFHDLLAGELEATSNSNSNRGSHQPSRECFMVDPP